MVTTGIQQLEHLCRKKIAELKQKKLFRQIVAQGPVAIDVSHNDYLDLSHDSAFQRFLRQSIEDGALGARSSRLVMGSEQQCYLDLESSFARFKGAPAALYYNSGYHANEAVVAALSQKDCRFFVDQSIHASFRDGLHASPIPRSHRHFFRHNDLDHLEELLNQHPDGLKFIMVESLYSMDGDLAPLPQLARLADQCQAVMIVDEAHSLGIMGPSGQGAVVEAEWDQNQSITINPCGKGMAAQGAFVCGPQWFCEFLINQSRRFIYTTAASPWLISALAATIEAMPDFSGKRRRLWHVVGDVHRALDLDRIPTPIWPLVIGDEQKALDAAQALLSRGIRCAAIRPPTVPEGSARLRLSLHAGLSVAQVDQLIQSIRDEVIR